MLIDYVNISVTTEFVLVTLKGTEHYWYYSKQLLA